MKQGERKVALRCAVYTRVSTNSGLEQDFNSLDNQREASEAYIKSQAHEGWKLVRERYDDGGFSGGSIERPTLQKLLDDVLARKIDIIVVYRVDRLTRSLADFAKLVELFDAHGVSFISVTQAFNTTTSMGRLTLNMLLSFAQFEREITGERIPTRSPPRSGRASGWVERFHSATGSRTARSTSSKTKPNSFAIFFVSTSNSAAWCASRPLLTPRMFARPFGRAEPAERPGAPISRGHLYWILSNPIYVGRLRHKGQIHDGLHPAIVDVEIWERVQQRLASQTQPRRPCQPDDDSFLVGKLYDDRGNRIDAGHASKGGHSGATMCRVLPWRDARNKRDRSSAFRLQSSRTGLPTQSGPVAVRANAIDGCHIDRGDGRGD